MAFAETKISHREWRKLFKKRRRKAIRQKAALERCRIESEAEERKRACPEYQALLAEKEQQEQIAAEREELERALRNAIWLEDERKAQVLFAQQRQKVEAKEREEQAKRDELRKQYEESERKLAQAKEERLQQQEQMRRMLHERHIKMQEFAATGVEDYLTELRTVHNTRPETENCKFFLRTGACRHGYRCSGNHPTPGASQECSCSISAHEWKILCQKTTACGVPEPDCVADSSVRTF
uniref:C3H1-type domain-containing protein n=1 Tax=Anopheles farauti TaxID=69004 RepID=A0A182QUP9_9DIPT